MIRTRIVAAATAALALAACGHSSEQAPAPDPHQAICAHYAELMVRCKRGASEPTALRATAEDFCLKGTSGRHDDVFGPRYVAMIECTRTAETCDALHACQGQSP